MKFLLHIAFLIASTAAVAERPMNELPMYGGRHTPEIESNEITSKQVERLGWRYYNQGDLDTAIKRFNQSWMFDRNNAGAYFGFGLIMGQRAIRGEGDTRVNLKESIRFLEMANGFDPKNSKIINELASAHGMFAGYLISNEENGLIEYSIADALFGQAYELDPKFPQTPENWSVIKFYLGDFNEAKRLLNLAVGLGIVPNPAYAKMLAEKMQ
ncbi:MAG: hypothetical protein A3E00_14345 [Curvibacter sp. RIFCSPHIGHO2_12_FULL_63_18]|nr:MAG: hypothetical protein A2037_11855 [Curvibacter sp. GWA2_63_95]OGP01369.1 MAG: hypothetical protein A3E00_14345 [Curvibacter sp. RIFCSPHIGHO2_12_FULL_63_18]HCX82249.1 hypothetical protein [Rhodoferax sp.]